MKALALLALTLLALACTAQPAPYTDAELRVDEPVAAPMVPATGEPVIVEAPEPVRPEALRVCVDVPASERAKVEQAVEAWAEATSSWRDWVIVDAREGGCHLSIFEVGPYARLCSEDDDGDGHAEPNTDALGCVDALGGLLKAAPDATVYLIEGRYSAGVVMHEIGHTLGLTHKDGGLMQAGWPAEYRGADWECPDATSMDRLGEKLHVEGLTSCALPEGL